LPVHFENSTFYDKRYQPGFVGDSGDAVRLPVNPE